MKNGNLEKYDAEERAIARRYAPSTIKKGFVVNAERLYDDVPKSSRLAYYRRDLPLLPLLFLYTQVVIFIPPCSMMELENRFGLSWSFLLKLIELKLLIPIIGNPVRYNMEHFSSLFEYKPASVWSRGDELALEFANGHEYWKQADQLIITDDFMSDYYIVNKFRKQFPQLKRTDLTSRIEMEVKTNYVDLCIFGHESIATPLLKRENQGWGIRRILELSERIVYPSLIGLGGTPNYGLNSIASSNLAIDIKWPELVKHGPELEIISNGFSLPNIAKITPEIIIEFHKDNMSKKLWKALETLEKTINEEVINLNDIVARTIIAQGVIKEAIQYINGVYYQTKRTRISKNVENVTDLTTKILPVLPIATLFWGPFDQSVADATLAGSQVVAYLASFKHHKRAIDKCEELISNALLGNTPKMANQLWWLSEWTKKHTNNNTL